MIIFKEIEIIGLFGESDICIPISDNRLILVGYNGIGKSTILNIFYYFISQQWHKLQEQDFSSVTLRLRNKKRKLSINRTELLEYIEFQRRDRRSARYGYRFPQVLVKDAYELLSKRYGHFAGAQLKSTTRHEIEFLREELNVPTRVAEELIREYRYMTQREFEFASSVQDNIAKVDQFISENLGGRILYLPTYRRIEKDLKTVFPEIEEELQRKLSRRRNETSKTESYIELVQFGMEDVKENLASRLESVKAYALSQINNLTTKYLRDVIRDEAKQYDEIATLKIDKFALSSVFSKVDSAILSDKDKEKITEVVGKIVEGDELQENEKYVAHYVLYLVEVGKNISELEKPIQQFVQLCNSYLYGKSFVFDTVSYRVKIVHASGRPVEMEELSSGEKQIVSLFSHLLLDQDVLNYIVIDEPELSLSVDWQQRFLEDISALSTCAFIGAVTHSPFIFENSLDAHTIDLLEHTKPTQ
jgi:energy-coupling factor transporter ATP-binding protein EcfA2